MSDRRKMEGKRVLVTGFGTDIGRETAMEFTGQGATVVLHYSHTCDGAASAVEEIRRMGGPRRAPLTSITSPRCGNWPRQPWSSWAAWASWSIMLALR